MGTISALDDFTRKALGHLFHILYPLFTIYPALYTNCSTRRALLLLFEYFKCRSYKL